MRLPFPDRVPLWQVFIFAVVICAWQQALGTIPIFSLCSFAFILLSGIAFNVAGGLTRTAGGYVVGYSILAAITGLVYKNFAGEPGQKNLYQPERTIEVYLAGITAILAAILLTRRLSLRRSLFDRMPLSEGMSRTATVCMVIGTAFQAYSYTGSKFAPGSLMGALHQLDIWTPLAILLGITAEIRESGGRRSLNFTVLVAMGETFLSGLAGFSKAGIYGPLTLWIVAAAAQRFKVSLLQIGGILAFLIFTNYYLVPYSQYGRGLVGEEDSLSQRLTVSAFLLTHLGQVRQAYLANATEGIIEEQVSHYFDKPSGIFDRLQMIAPDDELVNITENGMVYGYIPVFYDFENVIPHFILPNKPAANFGNIYAHELGMDEEDVTTGISFSPSGEAFHLGRWMGVLVVLPALLFMLFWIMDSICGDIRNSPLGLGVLAGFLHTAPEGGVGGIIGTAMTGAGVTLVFGIIFAYVIPVLSNVVLGPPKRAAGIAPGVESKPRRFLPARP